MYHQCKLVHADLSEYNILYHEGTLWIIDVSQSVEHDHPSAFDFLRKDLKNIDDFFRRFEVKCLGLRRSFEFVTKENLSAGTDVEDEGVLRAWLLEAESNLDEEESASKNSQDDAVFMESYIPRTLHEVYDPERDAAKVGRGEGKDLIYADTIGLVPNAPASEPIAEMSEEDDNDNDSSEEAENHSTDEVFKEKKPRGHKHEDREAEVLVHIRRLRI